MICPYCGYLMSGCYAVCPNCRKVLTSIDANSSLETESLRARIAELEELLSHKALFHYAQQKQREANTAKADLAAARAENERLLAAEHRLSDAYLRIRRKLNAFDTPDAPTPEQCWSHTEECLDRVLAENERLARELAALKEYSRIRDETLAFTRSERDQLAGNLAAANMEAAKANDELAALKAQPAPEGVSIAGKRIDVVSIAAYNALKAKLENLKRDNEPGLRAAFEKERAAHQQAERERDEHLGTIAFIEDQVADERRRRKAVQRAARELAHERCNVEECLELAELTQRAERAEADCAAMREVVLPVINRTAAMLCCHCFMPGNWVEHLPSCNIGHAIKAKEYLESTPHPGADLLGEKAKLREALHPEQARAALGGEAKA